MEYEEIKQVPTKVRECLIDAINRGFKVCVVEIDTLYKNVYYYPFPSLVKAAQYIVSSEHKMTYKRACMLYDIDAIRGAEYWAEEISINS